MNEMLCMIMAAGESSRMGRNKLLLPYLNDTVLGKCLSLATSLFSTEKIYLVTGAYHSTLAKHFPHFKNNMIYNSKWKAGLGSSIRSGILSLLTKQPNSPVLILLSDQIKIDSKHLQNLINRFENKEAHIQIVASAYGNTIGPPLIFSTQAMKSILNQSETTGAKKYILENLNASNLVLFEDASIDLDTEEDYALAIRKAKTT